MTDGQIMTKQATKKSASENLYNKHLRSLKKAPVNVGEPSNGGPRLSQFFEAVDGMGERALKNGTIARSVRERKRA
jgi:hypothetical protein